MSEIDGRWNIEAYSPMGKQTSVLDVTTNGETATGTLTAPDGMTSPIENAHVNGPVLDFTVETVKPMAMTIHITVTVDGDELTGKVKAGIFPPAKATGARLAG